VANSTITASCYYGKQLALDEVRQRCDLPVAANLIEVEDEAPNQTLFEADRGT